MITIMRVTHLRRADLNLLVVFTALAEERNVDAEETTFRVAVTDHASQVLCPLVCKTIVPRARKVSFDFVSFRDETFEGIDRGRLDLFLNAADGHVPSRFATETIFEAEFACVVAKQSSYSRALTLKQYLAASHVGVGILGGLPTIPDERLAAVGVKRRCPIWVPYFSAAIRCVPGTDLVATVPRGIAEFESGNAGVKVLKPPEVLGTFQYLMAWHPRMNTDAAHLWLRAVIREVGESVARQHKLDRTG